MNRYQNPVHVGPALAAAPPSLMARPAGPPSPTYGAASERRPYTRLLGNTTIVARCVSGGIAKSPRAHAQGYENRRFFPSGAKRVLQSGLHRYG
ncbi:MAG: hypothetical protein HY736_06060 [Verrucomicrobia bacterium]|nr:hypothetical protein [Verrucomicrobiota bacterium]